MPITLAQAQQLSQSKLTKYVIDEFRKSALLDKLPFDNTAKPQGGGTLSYVYNRVTTLPVASARALNTEYSAQEAATTRQVVDLKAFGGSFKVDRVIAEHERHVVEHVQFQVQQKTNATIALYHDMFINGDADVGDGAMFDGIDKAITGSTTELIPSAAIDLSSSTAIDANWKLFLDMLRRLRARMDGTPTLYLMNQDMFAVFQSVMDRAGVNLASKDNYGFETMQWGPSLVMPLGDKPGSSNPVIETDEDGQTSIYPVRLGLYGVHGVSPDGMALVKTYLPNMNAPGAVKTGEVEMVAAMALKASRSAAVLRKLKVG